MCMFTWLKKSSHTAFGAGGDLKKIKKNSLHSFMLAMWQDIFAPAAWSNSSQWIIGTRAASLTCRFFCKWRHYYTVERETVQVRAFKRYRERSIGCTKQDVQFKGKLWGGNVKACQSAACKKVWIYFTWKRTDAAQCCRDFEVAVDKYLLVLTVMSLRYLRICRDICVVSWMSATGVYQCSKNVFKHDRNHLSTFRPDWKCYLSLFPFLS